MKIETVRLVSVNKAFNFCKQVSRVLFGSVIGAAAGILKPAAEWLINAKEKVLNPNPVNRGRLVVLIDIAAAAVVLFASTVRFGTPAVWVFAATGCVLGMYGMITGTKIALKKQNFCEIPIEISKELWLWEFQEDLKMDKEPAEQKALQDLKIIHELENGIQNERELFNRIQNPYKKVWDGVKGAGIGLFAGAVMPFAQLLQTILAARRKWPIIINTGAINLYALYVGSTFMDPTIAVYLILGLESTFSIYGLIKGGYLGYMYGVSNIHTILWKGGFEYQSPSLIITQNDTPTTNNSLTLSKSMIIVPTTHIAPTLNMTVANNSINSIKSSTQNVGINIESVAKNPMPNCLWLHPMHPLKAENQAQCTSEDLKVCKWNSL